MIGAAIVAFATFVWVLLSGSLEQVLGPHGRPLSSRPTKRWGSATPLAQSRPRTAPGCQAEPRAGDALALIDCAALAYVLAERLSDALGRDFVVSATADNSLLVKHLEREQVITPRLGRFRLEPAATAIALTSQQMLSEVQWFVSETLNRPWPARPQLDDPGCLLQHSPSLAVSFIYRGKTARAPSRLSSRFHLKMCSLRVLMFRGRPKAVQDQSEILAVGPSTRTPTHPRLQFSTCLGLPSQS